MRIGLLDIVAAGALLIAVVLPSPSRTLRPLYQRDFAALAPKIADAQARVARDPKDGQAAAELSELLVRARQTDWAIRAGVAAARTGSPDAWRGMVAASAAHMDRYEIGPGLEWANRALAACETDGADCADFERGRLSVYQHALQAAFDSHIDPKVNPQGFVEAAQRAQPLIRIGKKK